MSDLAELAHAEQLLADQRATIARLQRELERLRTSREDYLAALRAAVTDAIRAIQVPPVAPPPRDRRRGRPEVAIAVCADWQLGKRTPTYDSEVCAERIRRYAAKVLELTDIQRAHHPVRECHVWLLGDLVEGELVFPGQAHRLDASLYRQVLTLGPTILGDLLRTLAGAFERVVVTGVIGNHGALGGRSRSEYHPESNGDSMLYEATRLLLRDERRVEWRLPDVPGERAAFAVDEIGSLRALLVHGDQVHGGFAGYPWYGVGRRLRGWALGTLTEAFGLPDGWSVAAMGHWHRTALLTEGPIRLYQSGSPESGNTWAAEQLGQMSRPEQWLLFADPEKGRVTAEYIVDLR